MNREAAIRVIDPRNDEKPFLRRSSDHEVVSTFSAHLRRFDSLGVSQRLGYFRPSNSALGMVSPDVGSRIVKPE